MDVGVHRLVADGKFSHWDGLQGDSVRMAFDNLPVAREPFEVAAVLGIVGVLVGPAEGALRKIESLGIMRRLIGCSGSVDAEADSVEFFAIGKELRNLSFVVEAPVEAAILLVPQHVV